MQKRAYSTCFRFNLSNSARITVLTARRPAALMGFTDANSTSRDAMRSMRRFTRRRAVACRHLLDCQSISDPSTKPSWIKPMSSTPKNLVRPGFALIRSVPSQSPWACAPSFRTLETACCALMARTTIRFLQSSPCAAGLPQLDLAMVISTNHAQNHLALSLLRINSGI